MIIETDQEVQGDVGLITRARAKKTQAQCAIKGRVWARLGECMIVKAL